MWASAKTLVFNDEISCHWAKRFPSNEGVKMGYLLNKSYHFTAICLCGV